MKIMKQLLMVSLALCLGLSLSAQAQTPLSMFRGNNPGCDVSATNRINTLTDTVSVNTWSGEGFVTKMVDWEYFAYHIFDGYGNLPIWNNTHPTNYAKRFQPSSVALTNTAVWYSSTNISTEGMVGWWTFKTTNNLGIDADFRIVVGTDEMTGRVDAQEDFVWGGNISIFGATDHMVSSIIDSVGVGYDPETGEYIFGVSFIADTVSARIYFTGPLVTNFWNSTVMEFGEAPPASRYGFQQLSSLCNGLTCRNISVAAMASDTSSGKHTWITPGVIGIECSETNTYFSMAGSNGCHIVFTERPSSGSCLAGIWGGTFHLGNGYIPADCQDVISWNIASNCVNVSSLASTNTVSAKSFICGTTNGLSSTKVFYSRTADNTGQVTNTISIGGGLITGWTQEQ